ncbi:lipopolysaccharide biosynthesis protein [Mariniflexile gromovii]|uniref:Oligosaccharide flippase family protein n=1 Tax=Mariniflexile gromovii TaxID=362523 RepID=A0ABS4BRZ5_9FLAO|nr:oligosaccharide flippase family protein [Mariniflexile gromovii]MBP0902862.1 oligosaccharide flippase family protein [Mariniflexile gromovii]
MTKKIENIKSFILSGNELSLKVKTNMIGLILIKGYSIAISFLLIPISLNILGNYKYGLWITIFNMLSMMQILDVGIGNGLRNMLTTAIVNNNFKKAKEYISTAYIVIGFLSLFLCIVFFIPWNYVNWSNIFNSDYSLNSELRNLIGITFVLTIISFFFNLINIILLSHHKPAKASMIYAFSNTIILTLFFLFEKELRDHLFLIGLIYSLVPIVVLFFVSIHLFLTKYNNIRPSFSSFKKNNIKGLFSIGGKFFIIQVSILIIFQTDALIISHFLSPSDVTPYNIVYKYFSIPTTVITIILTPLWAAYCDANENSNYKWIKKVLNYQLKGFAIIVAIVFVMLLVSKPLIYFWLGKNINLSLTLLFSTALFTIINIWNIMLGTFLNGIERIKVQLISNVIGLIINIPLSIFLIKQFGLGGVLLATSISLLFFSFGGTREVIKVVKGYDTLILNKNEKINK